MDRREAIKRTALLMGGVIFAPTISGALKGCTPRTGDDLKPLFFSESQMKVISELAEVIIPETDTPGAIQAGVPAFVDQLIADTFFREDQEALIKLFEDFEDETLSEFGKDFTELTDDEKFEYVSRLNEDAITSSLPETPFILVIKEAVILGFCTSEYGATQTLQHALNPGRYSGCLPLEEAGRQWAM